MPNFVILAVFLLSTKNLRGRISPPPASARVNGQQSFWPSFLSAALQKQVLQKKSLCIPLIMVIVTCEQVPVNNRKCNNKCDNKQTNIVTDALSTIHCHVYEGTSRFSETWLDEAISNINSIVYIFAYSIVKWNWIGVQPKTRRDGFRIGVLTIRRI